MHCNEIHEIMYMSFIYLVTNVGEFGLVYKGYLSSAVGRELVAVKTLKGMKKSFSTFSTYNLWQVRLFLYPFVGIFMFNIIIITYESEKKKIM